MKLESLREALSFLFCVLGQAHLKVSERKLVEVIGQTERLQVRGFLWYTLRVSRAIRRTILGLE